MQHTPLNGIRILELGGYISNPYATSLLCALGAEVVKVERPGTGDDFRRGLDDRSAYFMQYNAGKRSLSVDLKDRRGVELVKALLPRFDVVMENLRPGKLSAIGLGPEHCSAINPDIIYASITGFGNGGHLEQRPAYDSIGQAVGGLYSVLSDAGSARLSGTCLADLITGLSTATGVLAALVGRATHGGGQLVETSVMEAVSTLTIDSVTQYFDTGYQDPTRQTRHPQAQNFCVKTESGDHIAIHLSSSQKFWGAFCAAMGRLDLAEHPDFATYNLRVENYFRLVGIVEPEFAQKPANEWESLLTQFDVPFARVHSMSTYLADSQTEWLKLMEPERNGVALVRPPWRFDGQRPSRDGVTPTVGQHTRDIAREVYSDDTIDELVASGTLFDGRTNSAEVSSAMH